MRRELSRLVGPEHVLDAPAGSPYNRDAAGRPGVQGRADAVVLPASADEVAAVVAWCYTHDVPIVPRGGGTGLTGGAVAMHGGVVCSLERLRRVRELEPALWRMLPEAGVSTRHVQRLARENGLFFAPDPGAAEQSHIGGNVATNAGGPHALKYGVTGAWVAGLEVVLAPGELVQLGGWLGKDVAGYDLKSLLVGSEGTLGVITAAMLRLLPAPEAAIPLVVFLRSREEGCGAIEQVFAAGVRPSVLDFLDAATLEIVAGGYPGEGSPGASAGVPSETRFALIAEVDGTLAEAQAGREALTDLFADTAVAIHQPADVEALWRWRDGINGVVTARRGMKVSEDVVFPLERLREGFERFEQIAESHLLSSCAWGHGGDGNVHATVLVDPGSEQELEAAQAVGEELFALVVALGGSVAGEHGIGWSKRGLLALQWHPRAVEAHEQIKRVFDPKDLLNPGKKLARYPAPSPARSD
ncbi:MAG TPA: FAD-linked oxidase C-terminal domain-containing protein [Solirubrobacteraceae bacterium]|jgi:glycolate oxidase subunit GlcD|nr:FAD-linked oxidase C-terminal domain-containing protein [Solirubrobacteraceae bacterium]